MAKIELKGLEEYSAKLNRLSALSRDKIIGAAVYDGAKIVTDAIRAGLDAVPTDESWGTASNPKAGPSPEEKEGLAQSLGIAPLRDNSGFINVKIGFDGYQGKATTGYPKGKPNPMIARAVQRGTSFMRPNPFVKTAVNRSRKAAEAAMKKKAEEEISNIMN